MRTLIFLCLTVLSYASIAEEIVYEIYETSNVGDRLLAKGRRTYSIADVQVFPYKRGGKKIAEKYVPLAQGYRVGARIFFEDKLTGFGLLANRGNSDFSWEWYNRASVNRYKKLQGGTMVEVKLSDQHLIEELAEVHFVEDTVLSFIADRKGMEDTHKILIKAGSVLRLK